MGGISKEGMEEAQYGNGEKNKRKKSNMIYNHIYKSELFGMSFIRLLLMRNIMISSSVTQHRIHDSHDKLHKI
jgi:hypothetical protein